MLKFLTSQINAEVNQLFEADVAGKKIKKYKEHS